MRRRLKWIISTNITQDTVISLKLMNGLLPTIRYYFFNITARFLQLSANLDAAVKEGIRNEVVRGISEQPNRRLIAINTSRFYPWFDKYFVKRKCRVTAEWIWGNVFYQNLLNFNSMHALNTWYKKYISLQYIDDLTLKLELYSFSLKRFSYYIFNAYFIW